nr:Putative secreted protein [Kibdelosporangium sp. MJ126-NF4]CTQ88771.1 Putative secreted protein [Kibdelosporangium sp. MJ126-NF4]
MVLGVSVVLVVCAAPASAHVVSADADLHVAQTIDGAELTVVIRRTPEVPGPLYVDLVAYQPVRDLTIDLAVDGGAVPVRLQRDRPGTYPAVLHVRDTGPHELFLKTSAEFSVLPFRVSVPGPATWEIVVYGGFGATGLMLAAAIVAGAMSRRSIAVALGSIGVIAMVIAATVAVVSPRFDRETPDPGRPNAQAFLTVSPQRPGVGEPFSVRFDLSDGSTGLPVNDLAVHHDAIAHLVITSQDGEFFRHIHPLRTSSGRMEARLTVERPGRYLAYLELERVAAGGQLVSGTFEVTGPVQAVPSATASWTFPAGRPVTIELDTGTAGLQSWLGMAGHLITRDESGGYLGHVHEGSMTSTSDGTVAEHGPVLRFTTSFPRPGRYFAWVQYATDFRIVTVPHVVEVVG